ncbi:MAG: hypothetical protein ACWA40_04675 [Planktomarina sp.]
MDDKYGFEFITGRLEPNLKVLSQYKHLLDSSNTIFWVWCVLSIGFCVCSESALFERIGAIGLIYAILHFTISKLIIEEYQKIGSQTELVCKLDMLAHSITMQSEERFCQTLDYIRQLCGLSPQVHLGFLERYNKDDFKSRSEPLLQNIQEVHDKIAEQKKKSTLLETVTLIFATLQWAFGSYFVDFFASKGWTIC